MKTQTVSIIIISFLIIGILYLLKSQKESEEKLEKINSELEKIKKENYKLLDEQVAEFQFESNNYFRLKDHFKPFFDSLDISYSILRNYLIDEENISKKNQFFLRKFLLTNMPNLGGMTNDDVLKRMGIEDQRQIFEGTKLEISKRLVKGLGLNFMSGGSVSYNYYDIWRSETNLEVQRGETTKLMIRLLRNYEFRSNHLEFVPSEEMKLIEPYLGEFTVKVPNYSNEKRVHDIEFKLYDWINRDTIIEKIIIDLKKN